MKNIIYWTTCFMLLIASCSKDKLVELDPYNGEVLWIDSLNTQINKNQELKRVQISPMSRSDNSTILLSKTFTIDLFGILDFYIPSDLVDPTMRYTTIMTPINGNPSMFIYCNSGQGLSPYRMVESDPKDGTEKLSCDGSVLKPTDLELNFVVRGKIGESFHWKIYKELIPSIDTSIVEPIHNCNCEEIGKSTLICEDFELLEKGPAFQQTDYFIQDPFSDGSDASVFKVTNGGFDGSEGYVDMRNESHARSDDELNVDLGNHSSGSYVVKFKLFIPNGGYSNFEFPLSGGQFSLRRDGYSRLELFKKYNVYFPIPESEWVELELYFEPHKNLFRFRVGSIYYYWRTFNATNPNQNIIKFIGSSNGYKIDEICLLKFNY